MELVIMAGGLGSRFGGLKQLEPVDEYQNHIIDFSIYDAIKAGFDKIVFVIRKDNFKLFKKLIGDKVKRKVKIAYVFQSEDVNISGLQATFKRSKPFGTGHALLCAKNEISGNFAVINADDFYGRKSFELLFDFLSANKNFNNYCLIGFDIEKTLSNNGSVKRGVCNIFNGKLISISECSVESKQNHIYAKQIEENQKKFLADSMTVSMNMFGFSKNIFFYLEHYFNEFLKSANNENSEFFLPSVVEKLLKNNLVNVSVIRSPSVWKGLTYKADIMEVKSHISNLRKSGVYPQNLWD